MSDETEIKKARKTLSLRYTQPYHVNAIMAGDWDNGTLIKAEIEKQKKPK